MIFFANQQQRIKNNHIMQETVRFNLAILTANIVHMVIQPIVDIVPIIEVCPVIVIISLYIRSIIPNMKDKNVIDK